MVGHYDRVSLICKESLSNRNSVDLLCPEKLLDLAHVGGPPVIWQALHKHPAVSFFQNAVIEQCEQAAVVQGPDQAPESLLQRDDGRGRLLIEARISAVRD